MAKQYSKHIPPLATPTVAQQLQQRLTPLFLPFAVALPVLPAVIEAPVSRIPAA